MEHEHKWFVIARGPWEGEIDQDKIMNIDSDKALDDWFASKSNALITSVEKWFEISGFPVTERGRGFGEWSAGISASHEDAYNISCAFIKNFKKARQSGLVKLSIFPLNDETLIEFYGEDEDEE